MCFINDLQTLCQFLNEEWNFLIYGERYESWSKLFLSWFYYLESYTREMMGYTKPHNYGYHVLAAVAFMGLSITYVTYKVGEKLFSLASKKYSVKPSELKKKKPKVKKRASYNENEKTNSLPTDISYGNGNEKVALITDCKSIDTSQGNHVSVLLPKKSSVYVLASRGMVRKNSFKVDMPSKINLEAEHLNKNINCCQNLNNNTSHKENSASPKSSSSILQECTKYFPESDFSSILKCSSNINIITEGNNFSQKQSSEYENIENKNTDKIVEKSSIPNNDKELNQTMEIETEKLVEKEDKIFQQIKEDPVSLSKSSSHQSLDKLKTSRELGRQVESASPPIRSRLTISSLKRKYPKRDFVTEPLETKKESVTSPRLHAFDTKSRIPILSKILRSNNHILPLTNNSEKHNHHFEGNTAFPETSNGCSVQISEFSELFKIFPHNECKKRGTFQFSKMSHTKSDMSDYTEVKEMKMSQSLKQYSQI